MKEYQFEVGAAVIDYRDDDMSDRDAFIAIEEDDGMDAVEAELELFEFRVLQFHSLTTEFLETDSGNISHACGYWLVTIRGDDAVIDDFVAKFAAYYELEESEAKAWEV